MGSSLIPVFIYFPILLFLLYVVIFSVDQIVLKMGNKFQTPAIVIACIVIIIISLNKLYPLFNGFLFLTISGILILLFSEGLLTCYKVIVTKTLSEPKKLLPKWYLNISISKKIMVTVLYGTSISIPTALYLKYNDLPATIALSLCFLLLFFFRRPVTDFIKEKITSR